jgi:small subunit ribosomal protein S20
MANHKSAEKRARQTIKRTSVNRGRTKKVRRAVKEVEAALVKGDSAAAKAALKAAQPALAKGVGNGVLHRNTAARKLSRLNARLKKLATGASA